MDYACMRISLLKESLENQRFIIENYCKERGIKIDEWSEEIISGSAPINKRKICSILKKVKKDDTIICSEISRLGRSVFALSDIMKEVYDKNIRLVSIKEGFDTDNRLSRITWMFLAMCAEIERINISERTKEALHRKQAEGVVLGRPKGFKLCREKRKLYKKEDKIRRMIRDGLSYREMSKKLKCDRISLRRYINEFLCNDIHKKE